MSEECPPPAYTITPVQGTHPPPTVPIERPTEAQVVYRGCCHMPCAFWLWVVGIFLPVFWLVGMLFVMSRNPYERVWARTCIASIFIYLVIGLLILIIIGWWEGVKGTCGPLSNPSLFAHAKHSFARANESLSLSLWRWWNFDELCQIDMDLDKYET